MADFPFDASLAPPARRAGEFKIDGRGANKAEPEQGRTERRDDGFDKPRKTAKKGGKKHPSLHSKPTARAEDKTQSQPNK